MPKGAKISQKGTKMDAEIIPKLLKGANGEPKGVQKGEKDQKKGMPKTKPKKRGKIDAKRFGPAECAWPPQSAIMALPGLTRPILTKVQHGRRPSPGRAVLSPQSGSHGAPQGGKPARRGLETITNIHPESIKNPSKIEEQLSFRVPLSV